MSNSIEKIIDLAAPVDRVWRALTDADQFGEWFGVKLDGQFLAGQVSTGRFTFNEALQWSVTVDRIEPMSVFSYFWRPYAIDPAIDYSNEEPTLVTFQLEASERGTRLTITETGFDRVTIGRRAEALRMNTRGWEMQADRLKAYVKG